MRWERGLRLHLGLPIVAAAFAVAPASAQPHPNKDYCAANATNLVFAIDTTTPYDDRDKDLLVRAVGEIFEGMQGGDRVVIRTISDSFSRSEHLFDRCVPRCGEDGIWGKMTRCNQGLIVADTRQIKRELVQALRGKLSDFKATKRSDIVRSISTITAEEMQRGDRRILYVFSDLIENSDYISGSWFFAADPKALVKYVRKFSLLAQLRGAEVHAFGIGRDGTPQRAPLGVGSLQKLLSFWNAYFKESGAASVEITPGLVTHP